MIKTSEPKHVWALALEDLVHWYDDIVWENINPATENFALTIDLAESSEFLDCVRECLNAGFITAANRRIGSETTSELPPIHLSIRFTKKGLEKVEELKQIKR